MYSIFKELLSLWPAQCNLFLITRNSCRVTVTNTTQKAGVFGRVGLVTERVGLFTVTKWLHDNYFELSKINYIELATITIAP